MEERTVTDVCNFLVSRQVCPQVIEKFKLQKIDGKAVKLLSDDQLNNLGLSAIGDQVTLKDMCQGTSYTKNVEGASTLLPTTSGSERRQTLLRALRDSMQSGGRSKGPQQKSISGGRPKQMNRKFTFGLRVSDEKTNSFGDRVSTQVKSPLGDKNTISIQMPMCENYTKCLKIVKDAFFPKEENPVIGLESGYLLELVNCRNQNVQDGVETPFSFGKYIDLKKIPGTPKCYLFCMPHPDENASSPSCMVSMDVHDDDMTQTVKNIPDIWLEEDELPDLELPSTSIGSIVETPVKKQTEKDEVHVPGTPSGEVILTLRLPETTNAFLFEDDHSSRHIHTCLEETVGLMSEAKDPVEILRTYQKCIMRGRQLEIIQDQPNDGETTSIFVSRLDLFKTSMEEILAVEKEQFLFPIDVTFYGEKAEDLGGPRREFFTLILKEILDEKHELFSKVAEGYELTDTENNIRQRYYLSAGILCGLSMLQQGPLPCFLSECQLSRIFDQTHTCSEAEEQFKTGFNAVGLVDLINKMPVLKFLLRATAVKPLTKRQLLGLLHPSFCETGSTRRIYQDQQYTKFVSYIKEVAAGRREGLNLSSILRFVTGSDVEPILGFTNSPSVVFSESLPHSLPKANTCICQLSLPVGPDVPKETQIMFERYDLSFSNAYFGYA